MFFCFKNVLLSLSFFRGLAVSSGCVFCIKTCCSVSSLSKMSHRHFLSSEVWLSAEVWELEDVSYLLSSRPTLASGLTHSAKREKVMMNRRPSFKRRRMRRVLVIRNLVTKRSLGRNTKSRRRQRRKFKQKVAKQKGLERSNVAGQQNIAYALFSFTCSLFLEFHFKLNLSRCSHLLADPENLIDRPSPHSFSHTQGEFP